MEKVKNFMKKQWIVLSFIMVAIIFGAVNIRYIGSMVGPDIATLHYNNTYAIANGQWFSSPGEKDPKTQIRKGTLLEIPKKWEVPQECVYDALVTPVINDFNSKKLDQKNKTCEIRSTRASDEITKLYYRAQYTPLSWLPGAAGLRVGMALNLSPANSREMARIFNLLVYIALFAMAIKIIPGKKSKLLIVGIGLLPQGIFIASSLSGDAMNIGWAALFISLIIKLFSENKVISRRNFAIVIILAIGLFWLKVAYVPLILLILILGKKVIKPRNKWVAFTAITIFGTLSYVIWAKYFATTAVIPEAVNNLKLMLASPVSVIWSVIINIINIPSFALMNFGGPNELGSTLSSMTVISPLSFIILGVIGMIYISRQKFAKTRNIRDFLITYRLQIIGFISAVGSMGMTYIALMLTWTDVYNNGFMRIDGFQIRYVLPILSLFVVIFFIPNKTKKIKKRKK